MSGSPASRWASAVSSDAVPAEAEGREEAVRRAGAALTRPRNIAGMPSARCWTAVLSRWNATGAGVPVARAASNRRSPSSAASSITPQRLTRRTSARLSRWIMPWSPPHRPHAMEWAGRPAAARCSARALRKRLAAA